MSTNIGYHTRLYSDPKVRITGGSFGGDLDWKTVERLTGFFEVIVKPSGTCVFVDKEGREVRLYLSVDACRTEKGKAALEKDRKARQEAWEKEKVMYEQQEEELEDLMKGLTHEEIVRRLKSENTG